MIVPSFGMRGEAEYWKLRWGDLSLCYDSDLKQEYIDYNERQTKTRTREDVSYTSKYKPRMYARPDREKCPVMTLQKRGIKGLRKCFLAYRNIFTGLQWRINKIML